MLENWMRPFYQRYFIRIIVPILAVRVTPNQITVIAGISGIIASIFIVLDYNLFATIFLLLSGIFDTLDGSLARHIFQESDWGCAMDILTDRIVECAIIFGLFFIDIANRAIASMLMLMSILLCVTSFLLIGIFTIQKETEKSFYYSTGLIERFEAFIFFIAMIWLPNFFTTLAYTFSNLVFLTAFIRLYQFKTQTLAIHRKIKPSED